MELTGADFDRIRPTNVRVRVVDFAALWLGAERRLETAPDDWYVGGVVMTCRWLAGAHVRPPQGPRYLAFAPVTDRVGVPCEEDIEAEAVQAEVLAMRRPVPTWLADMPGWVDGIVATLNWAWRRSGPPPLTAQDGRAG